MSSKIPFGGELMLEEKASEELKRLPDEGLDEYINRMREGGVKMPSVAMIKTPEQILGCREAGRINSLVLDAVQREIRVGMTTADIDEVVREETKRLGGKCATLGYQGFPKSVCTSVNDVVCHGIPSKKEKLYEGDIVNVDCTTIFEGYYGDASRMFSFGEISETAKRLISVTGESVELAARSIRPYSSTLGDIGYQICTHVSANGFSVVREIGGHGVGLKMHEDPFVCHTGIAGRGILLVPGMIFTIEPMVNEGKAKFYVDSKDGWTVRTLDGSLSAQIECEILVTEDGIEVLSK
jgi:methionyl aminopeptidase